MSTNTKKIGFLSGILSAVKSLGNPETIEEDNNLENCKDQVDENTMKMLEKTDRNTDKEGKAAAEFLVTAERIKKEVLSIDRVLNAGTEAAMRKIHEQVQQKPVQPRKSEGREIDE